MRNGIGTLNESSLHSALKDWYKQPGDRLEVNIDNHVIDILRSNQLIEIQIRNFHSIKTKLNILLKQHKLRLILPLIRDKWIKKLDQLEMNTISRRQSPKHCTYIDLFQELIRIPDLVTHPNFALEVLLIQAEEILVNDGQGSWRRKGWSINDKKLINVLERRLFSKPMDYLSFLPDGLTPPFTNRELASQLNKPLKIASMMTYCLRKMDLIKIVGKRGRAFLFDNIEHIKFI